MKNKVNKDTYLYNISIIKAYLEYIDKNYPDADIDMILEYAGITRRELDDTGYWFTQEQSDRFYEIVLRQTKDKDIARKAGRFGMVDAPYSLLRQYIMGFVDPSAMCRASGKIFNKYSRATELKTRKIASNSVEMDLYMVKGVEWKPYQCDNLLGALEGITKDYSGTFASVEHTECIHRGGRVGRFVISWEKTRSLVWGIWRNYLALIALVLALVFYFTLPTGLFLSGFLGLVALVLGMSWYVEILGNTELRKNVKNQGDTAGQLFDEIEKRYNDAVLVQETGQAISMIMDTAKVHHVIMDTLKRHLDFDRGVIFLVSEDQKKLVYSAGYGCKKETEQALKAKAIDIRDLDSGVSDPGVLHQQHPFYMEEDSPDMPFVFTDKGTMGFMGIKAFICAPIVYEGQTLGSLVVDNMHTERRLDQSDMSLLEGIARQIAISISNTRSFKRLMDSEQQYRDLVENANSIILRIDPFGTISFFNRFALDFFGYREEEIIGHKVIGTILEPGERDGGFFTGMLKGMREHAQTYTNITSRNIRSSGERAWISWANKPILDKDNNLVETLWIGNDITVQRKVEKEKHSLELRLERAQKMEAIGTLAGGVAHDLNNILTGIVSYPDLLLMKIPDDSPLKRPLETIRHSGEKASAIVQDLLTLARRGISVSDPLNLNDIVNEYFSSPEFHALQRFHPDVVFKTMPESGLFNILGSRVHLSKSIMNMVTNAAEAMPEGGKVSVSTSNVSLSRPIRGYTDISQGEYVVLSIEDNGTGIPGKDIRHIFEPFYSKKAMGKSGTGLGMAVVWGTVQDHNGYIDLRSVEGKGTCIDIYLPKSTKNLQQKGSKNTLEDMQGSETILIVDDEKDQRDIASSFLGSLGYRTHAVASGEDAIGYFRENRADLVVLDMIMNPGMDGLETYRGLLDINPGIRALIVSGFSESDRVKEALDIGKGAYVKKPYVMETLGMAVRSLLDE
ncbi:MAG: ATP-binding protein [Thermodesulfobacteriota bacterium]|nr:ATP-binding protein [Thermodesulfobacteriota bacterium]